MSAPGHIGLDPIQAMQLSGPMPGDEQDVFRGIFEGLWAEVIAERAKRDLPPPSAEQRQIAWTSGSRMWHESRLHRIGQPRVYTGTIVHAHADDGGPCACRSLPVQLSGPGNICVLDPTHPIQYGHWFHVVPSPEAPPLAVGQTVTVTVTARGEVTTS
jgi:hypothetical protein